MSGLSSAVPGLIHAKNERSGPESELNSISFMQVQLFAYIIVFAATGLVTPWEIGFVIFVTFYALFLLSCIFRPHSRSYPSNVLKFHRFFHLYVATGTVIGLFLPLALVLGGFTRGDTHAVAAATPHLFLIACQLLTESLMSERPEWVSLPVRAIIPIIYNTRRLYTLATWIEVEFASMDGAISSQGIWPFFGRILALVNFFFWSINLFGFLVPVFLPRAFKHQFELEHAKVHESHPESSSPKRDHGKSN